MATIYSVTNFSGTKSWSDTSAWAGGVVPGTGDNVYIRGIRTTINMGSFPAWTGTKTITVASTSGFPSAGSFYTVTDRSQKVKIDYTGLTGTTFTGCTIDTSYFKFEVNNNPTYNIHGGSIFNGAYVHYTPIIEINNISVTTNLIIIEYGGYLKIHNNGLLTFGEYLTTRDGTLHVIAPADIRFGLNNLVSNSGLTNRIIGENYYMSRIFFEGTENRLNTTLTADVPREAGVLPVADASKFEINDYIMVKHPKLNIYRRDSGYRTSNSIPMIDNNGTYYSGSSVAGHDDSVMDECFNVAGKSGNNLYVSRMNSIDVKVLDTTAQSNVIIADSTRLEVGEKIIINNQVRTITNIEDYDHLLRDYDFTQASTTLDDWTTDTNRSAYFADWQKSSSAVSGSAYALIQHNTTSYRHIFIKDMMRQEVKVEAWISNYRNVTSGTNDGGERGICLHADPVMDYDRGHDSFGRSYFSMDRDNNRYRLLQRAMSSDSNSRLTTAGINSDYLHKYTFECRGGLLKGYIDDQLVNESFMRSGGYFGRVGLFCTGQNSFTCTRFKVYAAAQRITLDSGVTCSAGDTIYETGTEFKHFSGDTVVKQYSNVEDAMGHSNLAYCYGGAMEYRGDHVYPYMWNAVANSTTNYNRSTNSSFYNIINNQTVYDLANYNFASNTTTLGSMIIDLDATRTFTHITFQEYYRSQGQYFGSGGYIGVKTSNDRVNWTAVNIGLGDGTFAATVYDDRRRETGDSVRVYELQEPQNARYVMIYRYGGNNTSTAENRWTSLGVRDYSDGYKIKLSNVYDFAVGDRVMPLYQGAFNSGINESNYWSGLTNGSIPSSKWTNSLTEYYEVMAVDSVNKTLTLDRPYTHSFITRGDRLVKLNKSIRIRGDRGTSVWKTGRFNLYTGSNAGRKYELRHTEFTHMSSYYPTNYSTNYDISNWGVRNYAIYHADIFEGISYYNCLNHQTSYGAHFYTNGSLVFRDNMFMRWNGRGWFAYFPSQYSTIYNVGNVSAYGYMGDWGYWTAISNILHNYNAHYGHNNVSLPKVYSMYTTSLSLTPRKIQFRRNYANGGQSQGWSTQQNGRNVVVDFKDNMFEYMDDYILQSIVFDMPNTLKNVILPKRGNTDNRLTRFRNEGHIGTDKYMPSFMTSPHLENYNNWGYNLTYNEYTYWHKYPYESHIRAYRVNTTWQNALFGMMLVVGDDTTVTVEVGFNYFHTLEQSVLAENSYNGALVPFVVKEDAYYKTYSPAALAKPTSMTSWSGTYTLSDPGHYLIGIGQAARNGYVGFRNIYSKVNSTNPNNVQITANNFDMYQLTSPRKDYWAVGTIGRQGTIGKASAGIRLAGARLK